MDTARIRTRRAFTLLELLVVVVIIGGLMAILIPSLQQARQKAQKTACGAGMHGLGEGLQEYLSENNFVLPRSAQLPSINAGYEPLPITLSREVTSPKSWKCPGDNLGYLRQSDSKIFPSYYEGETLSYEYNLGLSGIKVERYFLYSLLGDHGTFVMADFDFFHGPKGAPTSKNVLFSDGHIGNVDEITAGLGKPSVNPGP